MAEREGFEPPIGLHLCRISSAVHSTTLPPLRGVLRSCHAGRGRSRRGRRGGQGVGGARPRAGSLARTSVLAFLLPVGLVAAVGEAGVAEAGAYRQHAPT